MTLSPAFLDELRARTVLSAVIAPSVKLLRAGREWKACCPFHNEKTPSFTVNDDKGFYHCFGCGAHGDAIRFLTDNRGMPFMDAVKELAAKAGLDVPAPDPRAQERSERASTLTDVMGDVARWFTEQLHGIAGAGARDYLKRRGIDDATVQRFGIGLAPEGRNHLKRALAHLGEDKLVETGMLIQPEEAGKDSYDRFRGRLMIPIRDPRGRVIAFGGRILGDGEPKYLNSPDTPLFDKGRTLYNIDRASPASRAARRLIVVEGYMDVVALDRAGIAEVVAPNGTAVTEAQLERMWRLDPSPILCFDGDNAGLKAAIRAALRALPHLAPDRTLRFVELPAGQDPDDVVRSGGREAFEALLAKAESLDARMWRHEVEAQPLTTPEARAGLRQRLINYAATIQDQELGRLYRAAWLEQFVDLLAPKRISGQNRRATARRNQRTSRKPFEKTQAEIFLNPEELQETTRDFSRTGLNSAVTRNILIGFINHPDVLPESCEMLANLPMQDRRSKELRNELLAAAFSGAALDRDSLVTILGADGASAGKGPRAMGFSFTRRDCDPDRARSDLAAAVEIIAAAEEVETALGAATERLKRDLTDDALEEQQRLIGAQQDLRQRLAHLAGTD